MDLVEKISNVVADFEEHRWELLPGYSRSYLNSYRKRLGEIDGLTGSQRLDFLGETAELLDSIADDPPFASGFHHLALKRIIQEVREELTGKARN